MSEKANHRFGFSEREYLRGASLKVRLSERKSKCYLGFPSASTFKVLKVSKVLRGFRLDNSGRVARDFIFYCYLCLRIIYIIIHSMGRNKFSQREIEIIGKLLRRKMAGTRFQQKMVRHTLRTTFEFNIADFNIQGKAFGPEDLDECVRRGRIQILDDATIEAMKQRHAEKRQRDEALRQAEAVASGDAVDWQEVQRQWDEYYKNNPEEQPGL